MKSVKKKRCTFITGKHWEVKHWELNLDLFFSGIKFNFEMCETWRILYQVRTSKKQIADYKNIVEVKDFFQYHKQEYGNS